MDLKVRPLKVQAGRNVVIRLEKGAEPEKIHQSDAAAEGGQA